MANHPQAPQGPQGDHDPAGNTQMFRAFVDEGGPQPAARPESKGPNLRLVVALVIAVALVAVAWLAVTG
ncbi:hypothetical protein WDH52_22215 [Streptomyces sp. TRM70308]|uniref:hypothetical protein n=1 Tax=Streptomyces TaxID=1883 RepID=UPI002248F67F|nr:hypothetical protein [Streptomyces sp. JHD 1]MCX2970598.1 hypothetical protein [Streptomyces sp. JHD 1]